MFNISLALSRGQSRGLIKCLHFCIFKKMRIILNPTTPIKDLNDTLITQFFFFFFYQSDLDSIIIAHLQNAHTTDLNYQD